MRSTSGIIFTGRRVPFLPFSAFSDKKYNHRCCCKNRRDSVNQIRLQSPVLNADRNLRLRPFHREKMIDPHKLRVHLQPRSIILLSVDRNALCLTLWCLITDLVLLISILRDCDVPAFRHILRRSLLSRIPCIRNHQLRLLLKHTVRQQDRLPVLTSLRGSQRGQITYILGRHIFVI